MGRPLELGGCVQVQKKYSRGMRACRRRIEWMEKPSSNSMAEGNLFPLPPSRPGSTRRHSCKKVVLFHASWSA